jgi:HNH endonuclease
MTKSRGINAPRFEWTEERLDSLINRYPNEKAEAVARDLGCSVQSVWGKAKRLGLQKSPAFLASEASGRIVTGSDKGKPNRFVKGQPSWIAGKKGINPGPGKTRFKPGVKPHNHVPVGTECVKSDGCIWVKLAEPNVWKQKHWLVWKDVHGEFPPVGTLFNFKDGNKQNPAIENLEIFTRQEWMKRHTLHNLPKELTDLILLRGVLTRQINKRSKHEQPEND